MHRHYYCNLGHVVSSTIFCNIFSTSYDLACCQVSSPLTQFRRPRQLFLLLPEMLQLLL